MGLQRKLLIGLQFRLYRVAYLFMLQGLAHRL